MLPSSQCSRFQCSKWGHFSQRTVDWMKWLTENISKDICPITRTGEAWESHLGVMSYEQQETSRQYGWFPPNSPHWKAVLKAGSVVGGSGVLREKNPPASSLVKPILRTDSKQKTQHAPGLPGSSDSESCQTQAVLPHPCLYFSLLSWERLSLHFFAHGPFQLLRLLLHQFCRGRTYS